MDTKQLIAEVRQYVEACRERGIAITHCCLVEAYPGDPTTSYTVHIGSPLIDQHSCSEALDIFIGIMWDIMSVEARRRIFSINLVDKNDRLHCASGELMIAGEAVAS